MKQKEYTKIWMVEGNKIFMYNRIISMEAGGLREDSGDIE